MGPEGPIAVNYLPPRAIHTDMARAVLLLVSDEADFITGHGLVVDGGLTLRT